MPEDPEPPEAILKAFESLSGSEGLQVQGTLRWSRDAGKWVFPFELTVAVPPGPLVPRTTSWWALLDPTYPAVRPGIYPSKTRGLVYTLFHQAANLVGSDRRPWRCGAPCLHRTAAYVRRLGDVLEPGSADRQLRWYVDRLREWLQAAARGELLQPGERLELPDLRFGGGMVLALGEGAQDWEFWSRSDVSCGHAPLVHLGHGRERLWIVGAFQDRAGRVVIAEDFKSAHMKTAASHGPLAVWVRAPEIPVIPPWQAPTSWSELVEALGTRDIDLPSLLWPLLDDRLRSSGLPRRQRPRHPLLVGFPVPPEVGAAPSAMHWIGFELPPLAEKNETRNGFRPRRRGRTLLDLHGLHGLQPLPWLRTQSWRDTDLIGRGRLRGRLLERSILLIGLGALGSAVAELLVRGGARRLTLLDGEPFEAGNLVRHTLTLDDLERNKAQAVGARLSRLSPHVAVLADASEFTAQLQHAPSQVREAVSRAEVVIDCSASDAVLFNLEDYPWQAERLFVSLAMAPFGHRIYCFLAHGNRFPRQAYVDAITPWVKRDWDGVDEAALPFEGVGCWNPLLPAKAADVWLLAAAVVRFVEDELAEGAMPATPRLTVFEQLEEEGRFAGVQRVPP